MTNPNSNPKSPLANPMPQGLGNTFTTPSTPQVTTSGGGNKNMMIIIVAVVLLLVAGLAGAYFYIQNQSTPTPAPTTQPTPTATASPVATSSATLDDEVNNIDLGDEDAAVKEIDTELQSL